MALSVPTWQPQIGPWTTSENLAHVTTAAWPIMDLFGLMDPAPITRDEAMAVPAVARARHLIVATIGRLPLEALVGDVRVDPTPSWMTATDGQLGEVTERDRMRLGLYTPQSPWSRMLATADDLLFFGWALWLKTSQGSRDPATGRRFPLRMAHVPYGSWDVDQDGRIIDPDGQPFAEDAAVLFQGMHEGILTFGRRSIRGAGRLEASAADRAERPLRFELHQTTDIELTKEERAELVGAARQALSTNDGILFTNSAVETKAHNMNGSADGDLVIGGRNASAVDVARVMNIPAAMIDATTEGSSLEYQTTETRNQQWLDYGLSAYMDPITSRLSMDDVMPRGQRSAFDTSSLTTTLAPTGPSLED